MIDWNAHNWGTCKECGCDTFYLYANGSISCTQNGHITLHYKLKKPKLVKKEDKKNG